MNTGELWLLGINDEYCNEQGHHGNWDCLECRLSVTLSAFFAALARYVALHYWEALS